MAIFADLHIDGWVGLKNPEHADVILEWSLVSLFFLASLSFYLTFDQSPNSRVATERTRNNPFDC